MKIRMSRVTQYWGPTKYNWQQQSDGWTCTLLFDREQPGSLVTTLTTRFYMGVGHGGRRPEAWEVLHALINDAQIVQEYADYGEFATGLGYDNLKMAKQVYDDSVRQTRRLRQFLGSQFDEFLQMDEDQLKALVKS